MSETKVESIKDLSNDQLISTWKYCDDVALNICDVDNPYHVGTLNEIVNKTRDLRFKVELELESRGFDLDDII